MKSFLIKFIDRFKRNASCPEKDKCLTILALVLDGEATIAQRQYAESHIANCMPCKNEFEVKKAIRILLQEKCTQEAPQDLVDNIKSKFENIH